MNPAIDGKMVRIPGYVLPLEFSGTKVSEFLLVQWLAPLASESPELLIAGASAFVFLLIAALIHPAS